MVACATTAGGPTLRQDMPLLPLPARAARRAETANCAAPQNDSARRSRAIALNTATPPASHWGVRSRSIPIIAPPRAATNMCPPFLSICLFSKTPRGLHQHRAGRLPPKRQELGEQIMHAWHRPFSPPLPLSSHDLNCPSVVRGLKPWVAPVTTKVAPNTTMIGVSPQTQPRLRNREFYGDGLLPCTSFTRVGLFYLIQQNF